MEAHVAQVNIASIRAPTDDPLVAEFVGNLDRVNALADAAPGFVWRLQADDGNATSIRAFPDPLLLVNMSVWESVERLQAFAYRSEHVAYVRRRAEWFVEGTSRSALWWVTPGTVPTVDEAKRRLAFLARHGPSPYAFRFGRTPARLLVVPTTLDDERAVSLVRRLDAELSAAYPEAGATHFSLDPASVLPPEGAMVLALLDGEPVGCGALRSLGGESGELKRMFVDPAVRGARVGAAILASLEATASSLGLSELVLETGVRQHAAIALYEGAGFEPTAPWGEYLQSPETSRCYRKRLTD